MPENIGRYRIVSELGKGAMGVVYKAVDPNIGRTVALKTMRVDVHGIESAEMLQRFKNEARAAGLLSHPNIVTIYDAGELEGTFYIAMEFMEGKTLQEVLHAERMLSPEQAVDIMRQVCAGLDYAHARGVIHRDIKPANIMILPDRTVKIMDFGIAKSGGSGLTSTGQVLGTPNYMSPEQVKGRKLDGRSDLFSLGVVLYEAVTGERPFTGENVTTIIYKIVNENPPAPADLDATVPAGLSAVVMRALSKTPEARYQNGAEFAQDLAGARPGTAEIANGPAPGVTPAAAGGATESRTIAGLPTGAAAAARAPTPTPFPSLQSTVIRAASKTAPVTKRSSAMTIALVILAIAAIAGTYVGIRRRPGPAVATANPAQQTAISQPAAQTAPEASAPSAPAAIPAASVTGDLHVVSTPAGAKVEIDGRHEPSWVTPFTALHLKPGSHTVAFAYDGYMSATLTTDVAAGKRASITTELQPVQAILGIITKPRGAHILVDGTDTGQVTPSKIGVNPGQHRVALTLDGFRPHKADVDVGAGQTLPILAQLKPLGGAAGQPQDAQQQSPNPFRRLRRLFGGGEDRGVLEIRTRPRGAEIWVDGRPTPGKTPIRVPVPVGTYRVSLRLPGFKNIDRTVTIEKGKASAVDENFVRQ